MMFDVVTLKIRRKWINILLRYRFEFVIVFIILLAVTVRIRYLNVPLLNAHYFRQTQTATVVRNFYLSGIDIFHTKLDVFGIGKEQYLLLEFPFYQTIVTLLAYIFGLSDALGRIVSIFFGIIGGFCLMLLVNHLTKNRLIGIVTLVFFLFAPLNIFFQQAYMIESTVVALQIISLYAWILYTEKPNLLRYVGAIIVTTLALLQKSVYGPFLYIPLVYLIFIKLEKKKFLHVHPLVGLILPLIIFIGWVRYADITNNLNGNGYFSLSNKDQQLWNFGLLADRFSITNWALRINMIFQNMTKIFALFSFVGCVDIIFCKKEKYTYVWVYWFFSMLLYYLIFYRIQSHIYYFMIILPILSIFASYGLLFTVKSFMNIFKTSQAINRLLYYSFSGILLYIFIVKSVINAQPFFTLDMNTFEKINSMNTVLRENGYILYIFPEYDWNSVYSYYTHRRGIVLGSKSVDKEKIRDFIHQGYSYMIVDNLPAVIMQNDQIKSILSAFTLVFQKGNLYIYKLSEHIL